MHDEAMSSPHDCKLSPPDDSGIAPPPDPAERLYIKEYI